MTQPTKPHGRTPRPPIDRGRRGLLRAGGASLVVARGLAGRPAASRVPSAGLAAPIAPLAGLAASLPAAARALERGQPVEWPALRLLDGSVLAPQAWSDRAAVVVFWATWCPFCTRHNPRVDALARAVAGRPMRVIGASLDRDPDLVRRHVREHGLGFAMTMDAQPLRTAFGLVRRVTPTTVVVDRRGRFVQAIPGEMSDEDVMALASWAGEATAPVDAGAR